MAFIDRRSPLKFRQKSWSISDDFPAQTPQRPFPESAFSWGTSGMMLLYVFFQFVPSWACVFTMFAFKRFYSQMDPLVTNQMRFFNKRSTTNFAFVATNRQMRSHVRRQLTFLGRRVFTVWILTTEYVTCVNSFVWDQMRLIFRAEFTMFAFEWPEKQNNIQALTWANRRLLPRLTWLLKGRVNFMKFI